MQKKNNSNHHTGFENRVMERIKNENIEIESFGNVFSKKFIYLFFIGLFGLISIFFTSVALERLTVAKIFGSNFIMHNFPWFGAALGFSFFLLAFSFAEKSKLFYKWGLIKTAVIFFVVILVGSYFVHKTEIHTSLSDGRLAGLYTIEGAPLEIAAGHIIELRTQQAFVFQTVWGKKFKVYVSGGAIVSKELRLGDSLFIAGNREGDAFIAKGIVNLSTERK